MRQSRKTRRAINAHAKREAPRLKEAFDEVQDLRRLEAEVRELRRQQFLKAFVSVFFGLLIFPYLIYMAVAHCYKHNAFLWDELGD